MSLQQLFKAGVRKNRQHKGGIEIETSNAKGGACGMDTHNKVRHLMLPRNTKAYGKVVRAHELLHAEYTRIRGDIEHPNEYIDNCAEDMLIQGERFKIRFPHLLREWASVALWDVWTCSKIKISQMPASAMRDQLYLGMLVELGRAEVVFQSLPRYQAEFDGARRLLKLAREKTIQELAKCIRMSRDNFDYYLRRAGTTASYARLHSIRKDRKLYEHICSLLSELLPRADESKRRGEEEDGKKKSEEKSKRGQPKMDGSGKMAIFYPPLLRRCRTTRAGRRSRNAGTHIKASRLHRLKSGSITGLFREKARDVAGIVLIDASGSMGVNANNLEKLCAILPASTIAYYARTCSRTEGTPKGCAGHLVVHASGGMRCEKIPRSLVGGGNGVDLHALRWMLSQECKGKKYFITDEEWASATCHEEDRQTAELLDRHRAVVTVLNSFEDAWEFFDTDKKHRQQ